MVLIIEKGTSPPGPAFDVLQHVLPVGQLDHAREVLHDPLGLRVEHGEGVELVHQADVHHLVVAALHRQGGLVEVGVEGARANVPQVVRQVGVVVDEPGAENHRVDLHCIC